VWAISFPSPRVLDLSSGDYSVDISANKPFTVVVKRLLSQLRGLITSTNSWVISPGHDLATVGGRHAKALVGACSQGDAPWNYKLIAWRVLYVTQKRAVLLDPGV